MALVGYDNSAGGAGVEGVGISCFGWELKQNGPTITAATSLFLHPQKNGSCATAGARVSLIRRQAVGREVPICCLQRCIPPLASSIRHHTSNPADWANGGFGWVSYKATSTGIGAPGDT